VFAEEKQGSQPLSHRHACDAFFGGALQQQQLFCGRSSSSIFSSALCRGVEKERNDHHGLSGSGWQQRAGYYSTHRKETSPFYAFSALRTTKGS
jgi:hypothetical protein